jgi:hypothetical protein
MINVVKTKCVDQIHLASYDVRQYVNSSPVHKTLNVEQAITKVSASVLKVTAEILMTEQDALLYLKISVSQMLNALRKSFAVMHLRNVFQLAIQ